jgi:UDP-N-acetylmuramoyl-L-alanyl-D-glutamate--2,6-diaminopimelate ligase
VNLYALLEGFTPLPISVPADMLVSGLCLDSRQIEDGNAFVALNGAQQHGLAHAGQAIANGAGVIIFDPAGDGARLAAQVKVIPIIAINDLSGQLGNIAARFYGQPSQSMAVIGLTGTNGKTSCSQFLAQMLEECGIIGTLGWGEWGRLHKTLNTTPDALSVQQMLASLLKNGKRTVAMEVSSHGLAQGRVNGVHFKGVVFTNITRDHLDYHGTMDAYLEAKLALLTMPGITFVVVNLDDASSDRIIAAAPNSAVIWGVSRTGKFLLAGESLRADNSQHHADGLAFDACWRSLRQTVSVPLYGDFNTENALLVLATMLAMGIDFAQATAKLRQLKPISGRMECFGGANQPLVFVDYAHTPDALDKALASARQHCRQALWVVFGCGGNRDAGKRPLMGASAIRRADHVIITDDNPRFEDSTAIINTILAGHRSDKIEIIQNREQAIQTAIQQAACGDCIVIAGKGHEDYQEIAGVRYPFSDQQVVLNALAMRDK